LQKTAEEGLANWKKAPHYAAIAEKDNQAKITALEAAVKTKNALETGVLCLAKEELKKLKYKAHDAVKHETTELETSGTKGKIPQLKAVLADKKITDTAVKALAQAQLTKAQKEEKQLQEAALKHAAQGTVSVEAAIIGLSKKLEQQASQSDWAVTTHTCTHTHTRIHTCTCTHARTCTYMHMHMHMYMHTRTAHELMALCRCRHTPTSCRPGARLSGS